MDRNGFGGPYGSSGKLTTLQAGDNGRLSKATGPEVGAEPRGPWATLGVPRFPECAEAATLEPEGLRPRETPGSGAAAGARGVHSCQLSRRRRGGKRAQYLRRLGWPQSERAAARWKQRAAAEPEEGHGAAAGLLSTGARAAGGTVSASKGRGPYRAAPQAPLAAPWGP